jgi:hypothetical protein
MHADVGDQNPARPNLVPFTVWPRKRNKGNLQVVYVSELVLDALADKKQGKKG